MRAIRGHNDGAGPLVREVRNWPIPTSSYITISTFREPDENVLPYLPTTPTST